MTKFQFTNNNQSTNASIAKHPKFGTLAIGYWSLFVSWLLVIGYLLVPNSASSQSHESVQAIQSAYQSITDLQANFVQSTHVAVLGSTIKEPGVFSMKKPGMMRIEYTGEHPKQYISNGKKLWIVSKELEQVETYKVDKGAIPKEALEFLNGFADMEKFFIVNGWKPKNRRAASTYLRLVPKNGKALYNWLDCEFGSDNLLKTMAIHNKSGNVSTYVFSNIKVNWGLEDDLFVFKP